MQETLRMKGSGGNNSYDSKSKLWRTARSSVTGWLFVLPAVILMAIFTFYPIVNSLIAAFLHDYSMVTGTAQYTGFGFDNFKKVITNDAGVSADFVNCLINTLVFSFISVPVSTLIALLIAAALNSIKRLQKLYQTVLFLPYLTNAMAMGAVFATFFNVVGTKSNVETAGLVNTVLGWFGIPAKNWINPNAYGEGFNYWRGRFVVIIYEIWSGLPFKILILFSAMQNVNKQNYDAAKIDGSTGINTLFKITVPLISPMISYLLITGLMGGMKAYTAIVGIFGANMGPNNDFEMGTMVGYIYECINQNATGYAAAGSIILFLIIMVFTAINLYVSKKKVHY